MQRIACMLALVLGMGLAATAQANLFIDFNSTTQDGGAHNEAGYQAYDAGHEVAVDFVRKTYSAFSTTIGVTPDWPNTTDNRVRQMADRNAGNDANWLGNKIDLLTDYLGTDTRVGNGGNGDWDRITGTPTFMTLTLDGLAAGTYNWLSYHHDTENVWARFQVEISLDGGVNFAQVADLRMTDSSPGGNPDSEPVPGLFTGNPDPDPANLPSTLSTSFAADGTNDVVLRFAPYFDPASDPTPNVHTQIWGINGFELTASVIPEPTTLALSVLAMARGLRRRA